ncbi:unnamed protein product [Symbiodinium sp. CCMP2592]|nr:unnamed protein product [Symbiodinium sp. CCMP2592]
MKVLGARRQIRIHEGDTQAISNTARALATLLHRDEASMSAASAAALLRMPEFDEQGCATMAFAFAALEIWRQPLLNASVSQCISILRQPAGSSRAPQLRHLLDTLAASVERSRGCWDDE